MASKISFNERRRLRLSQIMPNIVAYWLSVGLLGYCLFISLLLENHKDTKISNDMLITNHLSAENFKQTLKLKTMFFKSIACAAACCVFLSGCRSGSEFPEGVVTVNFHDYIEKPLSELPGAFHSGKRYVALTASGSACTVENPF